MNSDPFYNPIVPARVPPGLVHDFNVYDYAGRDPFEVAHETHLAGAPEIFWTRNNGGHWIASRAAAINDIAAATDIFSSERQLVPDHQNLDEPSFLPLVLDPPVHREYRQLVAPFFMPKAIAGLEARAAAIADVLIADVIRRGECEFLADFASQMPVAIFLELLDISPDDRVELLDIAGAIIKPDGGEHRSNPLDRLFNYVRPLVEARRIGSSNDIVSQLMRKSVQGRALAFDDAVKLTATLLLGGLDTVSATLTFMAAHLASDPMLRRRLIDNPALIPATVEECLRRFPVASPGRIVRREAPLRGISFAPGDHVVWPNGMYNLDDSIHADPMAFDVDRPRGPHAGFGIGVHFCIGAFLARMEMRVFLDRWLKQIPDFSMKAGTTLRHRTGITIALEELPLQLN